MPTAAKQRCAGTCTAPEERHYGRKKHLPFFFPLSSGGAALWWQRNPTGPMLLRWALNLWAPVPSNAAFMMAYGSIPDDQDILLRLRAAGTKERAFQDLLSKYSERLYWHIRRMVVSHEDANDVLQNASIKIWKGIEAFREDSSLYTWLYRIASNEALTFLDAQRRHSLQTFEDFEIRMADKLVAEKNFNPNQAEWCLQRAIQRLPGKQQLVFQLRYFEEMSYEQMHEVTGTSVGALKASYHHAVKKIETFLKENSM